MQTIESIEGDRNKVKLNYSNKMLIIFGVILFVCVLVILLFVKLTFENSSSPKPITYQETHLQPSTSNTGNGTQSETGQASSDDPFSSSFFGLSVITWAAIIGMIIITSKLFGRRGIFRL